MVADHNLAEVAADHNLVEVAVGHNLVAVVADHNLAVAADHILAAHGEVVVRILALVVVDHIQVVDQDNHHNQVALVVEHLNTTMIIYQER